MCVRVRGVLAGRLTLLSSPRRLRKKGAPFTHVSVDVWAQTRRHPESSVFTAGGSMPERTSPSTTGPGHELDRCQAPGLPCTARARRGYIVRPGPSLYITPLRRSKAERGLADATLYDLEARTATVWQHYLLASGLPQGQSNKTRRESRGTLPKLRRGGEATRRPHDSRPRPPRFGICPSWYLGAGPGKYKIKATFLWLLHTPSSPDLLLTAMLRQALRATRPRLSGRSMATASHGQVMDLEAMGRTMPPNHKARVGLLDTFELPAEVRGTAGDRAMGKAIVESWRRNGILQIAMSPAQEAVYAAAQQASERFFTKPPSEKHACADPQSYSGYIASGEEITDGVADYSEIFTVTKDLPLDDRRVLDNWPCHGPCPWPDADVREPMRRYMDYLDQSGEKLLKLTEYGLGVPEGSLTNLTRDGWHHMRILSFQAVCKPLPGHEAGQEPRDGIHYGTHFTNMFLRNYPDRITTQRLLAEGRQRKLSEPALRTMPAPTGIP
ncbi:hypothetical protein GGTG_03117 [Gaeumannomyces tritici R3-111a-1]|uniref:Non-haem dioxygenase N-terminal domain-containing protein n=1 Tax=Gaeumannomyces tritici (strain R3-111a-1) TaxID=644352 RepID=J3NPA9_GAET3|nr:hypothetical protein GGTG_03117 [Gaeumannomyces tritici R3-111a-1]EJT78014.1 hypothetical protein GGTG_03117 [Gaeumannomyces tritici R3-111a-1]